MNRYSPSISRKQYDFMRRIVDETRDILQLPQVLESLGEKAVSLIYAMEHVVARPVADGFIEWGHDDDRNTIHAVSLNPGQSLYIPHSGSNERQYDFGSELFGNEAAYGLLLDKDEESTWYFEHDLKGMMVAATRVRTLPDAIEFPLRMYSRGRPTIVLRYEEVDESLMNMLTMIHELDHATNAMIYPIHLSRSDTDYHLRNELSAYCTQSLVARAIGISDERYLPHIIERIRYHCNGDCMAQDAYRTDSGVFEAISQAGLSVIFD